VKLRFDQEEEWSPDVTDGVVLGRMIGGESALPVRGSAVIWPFEQLNCHAVIFGEPASRKTETAVRMAHDVALKSGAPVFCLDVDGDPGLAERFATVMGKVGRRVRVFPDEPFDAWRGDPGGVATRLHTAAGFERDRDDGDRSYEADLASVMLSAACRSTGSPPRSSDELLARLGYEWLVSVDRDTFSDARREVVERVRLRLQSFFEELDGAFDGDYAWDDTDAAYIRLDTDWPYPAAPNLVRFFLEGWVRYLRQRGTSNQPSLMLVSGLTEDLISGQGLQRILGEAGRFGAGVVLTWNSPADIGPETQRSILLAALWTIIVHRTRRPEDIGDLAGERSVPEVEITYSYRDGRVEPGRLIRRVSKPKLTRKDFLDLSPGTAWIIESGLATKVAIEAV
jgi:hypothetical protein